MSAEQHVRQFEIHRAVKQGNSTVWLPTKIGNQSGHPYDALGVAAAEILLTNSFTKTPSADQLLHFTLCESSDETTRTNVNIFLGKIAIASNTLASTTTPSVVSGTLRSLDKCARQCIAAGLRAWLAVNAAAPVVHSA